MPIVYPAKIVEKIKTVIKEVIKPVGFSPSVGIDMEITVEPSPPPPQTVFSFPLGLSLRLYSLRLHLPYPITCELILNPVLPIPHETYLFSLGSGWEYVVGGSLTSLSLFVVTNPVLPSVTVISYFTLSVYGEVETGSKIDISTSIVTSPTPPAPAEVREFSTSVGVRKSP